MMAYQLDIIIGIWWLTAATHPICPDLCMNGEMVLLKLERDLTSDSHAVYSHTDHTTLEDGS